MPFTGGPGQSEGLRALLMGLLEKLGQVPDAAMGPHADMANEILDSANRGGARGDDVMGAMPMLPPGGIGKALGGMSKRLRGVGGGFQGGGGAGTSGVPHTSPLPNKGAPARPPSGGPSGSGSFGDNMAGTIRGDVAPPRGSTLGDAAPIYDQPGWMTARTNAMQHPDYPMVSQELQLLGDSIGHEDAVLQLARKYGDWVLNLL